MRPFYQALLVGVIFCNFLNPAAAEDFPWNDPDKHCPPEMKADPVQCDAYDRQWRRDEQAKYWKPHFDQVERDREADRIRGVEAQMAQCRLDCRTYRYCMSLGKRGCGRD